VTPAPAAAPSATATPVTAAKPITTARIESRSLDGKSPASAASGAASVPSGAVKPTGAPASGAVASSSPVTPPAAPAAPVAEVKDADEPVWTWPSTGPVVGNFEEGKRKGLVFSGKAGDPVMAAADGRVVYAGSGLRGYGNLVIVKHNASYLTAYAHNQTLLVKEDQVVRKGQKIAEMGNTDADRVQLHFEVRKQGKPIDPAKSLPGR
jgi:lipoprotein NlpD